MFARVGLERVRDNPFQTRGDYGDVTDLMESLLKMRGVRPETSGLLQVPVGRVVMGGQVLKPAEYGGVLPCLGDEPGAVVELAAGHRRLRAFRFLYEGGDDEYGSLPVSVQVIDDEAMADVSWEENARRKDLSPIEEAEALQRAMETFGWTQAGVGARWGLSQGAVANKLRLLKLPEEARAAVQAGLISERHGRVLLTAAGKSERVYRRVAEAIIPVVLDEEATARAREVMGEDHYYIAHVSLTSEMELELARCGVCGGAVEMLEGAYSAIGDERRVYLCAACYRAATGWSAPSVAEAEVQVKRAIRRESNRLDWAEWPMGEVVGDGDPLVRSARCEGCGVRESRENGEWCLDSTCFKAKKEHWFGYFVAKLESRLRATFDAVAPVIQGSHGGYDLRSYDEVDVGLVKAGVCRPGKCERLRFRYVNYRGSQIRPVEELPFIYSCNNTNSHKACQRRYVKGLDRSESELAAERLAKREAQKRRREGKAILDQAILSLGRAMMEGHEKAWYKLAAEVTGKRPEGDPPVEAVACLIAGHILSGNFMIRSLDWGGKDVVGRMDSLVRGELERIGVGMLASVGDVESRISRISGFIHDEEDMPRDDLTWEQIQGNLDNLDGVHAELEEMQEDGRASERDFERLDGWMVMLREALRISWEMREGDERGETREREKENATVHS